MTIDLEAIKAGRDLLDEVATLRAVLTLHRPITRWQPDRDASFSFETWQEAVDYCDGDETAVASFQVCAHCADVESWMVCEEIAEADEWGYRESLWPCPTARALGIEP